MYFFLLQAMLHISLKLHMIPHLKLVLAFNQDVEQEDIEENLIFDFFHSVYLVHNTVVRKKSNFA
jgi:hypothetical protein